MSSIDRRPHVLKREKTLTIPRRLVFFDTETKQIPQPDGSILQEFRLGWLAFWQRAYGKHRERTDWHYFDTVVSFWDYIFDHTMPKQRLWVIARNIVFDFTVCSGWEHLKRAGYKLKFFHNNGCSVIVTVRKGNRSIVFLDSMNWFTESLAKTGERIGIPKMEIVFDTCTVAELSRYCKNDVRIELENFRIFIRFLQDNTISRLCYTKASTAMAAYLFRHCHTPIYIHNNKQAIDLERDSYKGGRCECFYIGALGDEPYYILDVNSIYPYVMAENLYPVKYEAIRHNMSISELRDTIKDKSVVAKVRLQTDEPVYAIRTERTLFPVGDFVVTLCTPEIRYALEHNHIVEVMDVIVYQQANIFRSYVETLYKLRQGFKAAKVKSYDVLCKDLLNSLYGKFGQRAENWLRIGAAPNEPDREELIFYTNPRKVKRLRYLLGEVFELTGHSESFDSFPAIAAHVTAYARMLLWSLMQTAGIGNYLYCDTDSLIVTDRGLDRLSALTNESELGKLKLEEQGTHLIIMGLKDYVTERKTVIKGVSKNAEKIADNVYRQQSWPSFRGLLKSKDANTYLVKTVTKHLTREYAKGTVTQSGVIQPFLLEPSPDIH